MVNQVSICLLCQCFLQRKSASSWVFIKSVNICTYYSKSRIFSDVARWHQVLLFFLSNFWWRIFLALWNSMEGFFSGILVTWTGRDMKVITRWKYITQYITYKMYELQINNISVLTIVNKLIDDRCCWVH